MKIVRSSIFFISTLCFFLFSFSSPQTLKKQDVRKTMQEMLAYHVDYKEFSAIFARRSIKLYVQQFDLEKTYLLAHEAKLFLDPKDDLIESTVRKYKKDDLSEFEAINQVIEYSVMRTRRIRAEVETELALSHELLLSPKDESYLDYPKNEKE